VAYSWHGSKQRFCTIPLEGEKSKIRPQAGADNLNRPLGAPFCMTHHKLLNVFRFKNGWINEPVFESVR
jgi:hypothetical protein